MSEVSEVSWAGLENKIVAVKSENNFLYLTAKFLNLWEKSFFGRLHASGWDLRIRNDYYITKMYLALEKKVAFGIVWLQLYDKTTYGTHAA